LNGANAKGDARVYATPYPQIKKVYNTGKIEISFSETMMVPPLSAI